MGAARTITPELKDTGANAAGAVSALIDTALAELGGIDQLVNSVGGGDEAALGFLDAVDAERTRMFDINVLATVRATRAGPAQPWPETSPELTTSSTAGTTKTA